MRGVTVCAEANFAARKAVHELQHRVSARLPSPPDAQRSLANIDVTRAIATVPIATVDARSTDEAIQAGSDCFHGVTGFNQDPHLEHVSGFAVVGSFGEAGGDNHAHGVFVDNEAVQRTPPTRNSATQ